MSETRYDKKKKDRTLHTGESMRKDGRYVYKYVDNNGKTRFVYSWRLTPTDKVPKGKRDCEPLRDIEKRIRRELDDGIDASGKKMNVCELYTKYTRTRGNVTTGTELSRNILMRRLEDDELGNIQIGSVKPSTAKEWALRMKEKGLSYNTINNDRRSLSAAFYMAVQDDLVRKNPFMFNLNEVLENDTESKTALTKEQEKNLLEFIQNDKVFGKYYNEFVILLGTGLRISELCGLTVNDVDLDNGKIIVDHQLLRHANKDFYVNDPKTKSSNRKIPITGPAREAFQRVLDNHVDTGVKIDGYSGFLFNTKTGYPKTAFDYEAVFRRLVVKYNKCHEEPLPTIFTPHVLRHTFCTNMANAGMKPKQLQYVMGHKSINMTLDYYAHADYTSVEEEMNRVMALIYQ